MKPAGVLRLLFVVQALCAMFVLGDVLVAALGLRSRPVNWQLRELLEILAVIGLFLGTVLGVVVIRRADRQMLRAETDLRAASGAFTDVLEARFTDWRLSPAEVDVALFAIKGLDLPQIAAMRATSEGTIAAQLKAIFGKAGVSDQAGLVALLVADLLAEATLVEEPTSG